MSPLCVAHYRAGAADPHRGRAPMARRRVAWQRLAQELNLDKLAALSFDLAFDGLPGADLAASLPGV